MTDRITKVNELIRNELSKIVLREVDFEDQMLVTIVSVETSRTLEHATVYVSVIPDNRSTRALGLLRKHVYGIQQELNNRLSMRTVPKIRFVLAGDASTGEHIEKLIEEVVE